MKSYISSLFALLLLSVASLQATPSSSFWTICTTDIVPAGMAVFNEDVFFTVFNPGGREPFFPPDTGIEVGAFSWKDWSIEAGIDYLGGVSDPCYFNAAIGIPEDTLFCHAPALKVGIFNAGTRYGGRNRTNQNIFDIVVGKSLPEQFGGRVFLGAFSGNRAMGKNRQGVMFAFQWPFCLTADCDEVKYYKWILCGDYATGNNAIGGGGLGIYYFFTPNINILTGPVWFNSYKINGAWKWSIQINIGFPVFKP